MRFQVYELCCNFNYMTLNHDLRKSDRFCACDCMDWLGACVKITLFCSKSANMLSTSCVRTACPKLSTGLAVNNFYSCINVVDIIRLVARLFQQVRYSLACSQPEISFKGKPEIWKTGNFRFKFSGGVC